MSKSPKTIEEVQQYHPSAQEAPMWNAGSAQAYGLNQHPQEMYPNQTFVGASGPTQQAIQGMQDTSGMLNAARAPVGQQFMQGIQGGSPYDPHGSFGAGFGAQDVANNPYVNNMMQQNANMSNQNLQNSVLPQLQQGANAASGGGARNMTRQGVAEGVATGMAQQGLDAANAQTQMGAYGQGLGYDQGTRGQNMNYEAGQRGQTLGHQQGMFGQLGNMTNFMNAGNEQMFNAGRGKESYQQLALNDAMERYYHPQKEAGQRADTMINRMGQMKSGADVNSKPNPNYQSPLQQGVQMAAGIASTASGMGWAPSFGR